MKFPDDWHQQTEASSSRDNDALSLLQSNFPSLKIIQSSTTETAALIDVEELSESSDNPVSDFFSSQSVPILYELNTVTKGTVLTLSTYYGAIAVMQNITAVEIDGIVEVGEIAVTLPGNTQQLWKVFRSREAINAAMQRDAPRKPIPEEEGVSSMLRSGLRNTPDSSEPDNLHDRESWFKKRH